MPGGIFPGKMPPGFYVPVMSWIETAEAAGRYKSFLIVELLNYQREYATILERPTAPSTMLVAMRNSTFLLAQFFGAFRAKSSR